MSLSVPSYRLKKALLKQVIQTYFKAGISIETQPTGRESDSIVLKKSKTFAKPCGRFSRAIRPASDAFRELGDEFVSEQGRIDLFQQDAAEGFSDPERFPMGYIPGPTQEDSLVFES